MIKNLLPFIVLVVTLQFSAVTIKAQSNQSCCAKKTTDEFAMFGQNESFVDAHLSPQPFHFMPAGGKMISVKTKDGKDAAGFEIKSAVKTANFLFVFQEWWGLNDYMKQEAQNLSEELGNVNVIALDLYDGLVTTNQDDAGKLMQAAKDERIRAIISAFISYAGPEANIQTVGWCFGGGWSLQASLMAGKQATGCVMYYGMPERDKQKLKELNAPVLGIFAGRDEWITPEIFTSFEKDMKELGKNITVKSYDAVHAFANPSNPKFNKEAKEDAHMLVVKFLREHLK